ncbi:CRISPR-associated helicase Cas3' [Pontiella desulfatans]|nr:CRISPR-associated helicase Cas3' [Pontiella desulfatans]
MYLAHQNQSLQDHLRQVAELSGRNAEKIGLTDLGTLLGLLHDTGKYSSDFQVYIRSAIGLLNQDVDEEYVDAGQLRGTIDHSTAGAQILWNRCALDNSHQLFAQILALCLVSHHSGLIDCLSSGDDGIKDSFTGRINKPDNKTHRTEVMDRSEVRAEVSKFLEKEGLLQSFQQTVKKIYAHIPEKRQDSTVFHFQLGLLVRFLFSCLIDADRQDTADSEKVHAAQFRQNGSYVGWNVLIERLEQHLKRFGIPDVGSVNWIRSNVSRHCLESAGRDTGLFSLTVPTGGGKTLASLRFALHHAQEHEMDRIIYVIPFTSIIDQNACEVRKILEVDEGDSGRIVLEHHSNVGAERQSWKEKLLCDNWDAPIVYTTMVQFLEALFGGGTRGARRMHQLARSVIVFDEIQTLPIRCVHMFCNSVNFLVQSCGSSVVLCTATQPLLGDQHIDRLKGALALSSENEMMPDVQQLFDQLKRVEVRDERKPKGWAVDEIAELTVNEVTESGSCLVVVNTKKSARELYGKLSESLGESCFHLSTGMCPAHRREVLDKVKSRLDKAPVACVSTQLIEAGVDIDFASVIRYLAGLDSIAQAAGRCNRHGARAEGRVFVVNPAEENIDCLKDIAVGRDKANTVLDDYAEDPAKYGNDRIGPPLLEWYYQNYFYDRSADMVYPVSLGNSGQKDNLLNLLSTNPLAVSEYQRVHRESPSIYLRQSFKEAGRLFKSIDAPTQSVIVPFGKEGKDLIGELCGAFDVEKQFPLLRKAQQFSVNLFPHEFRKLQEEQAIFRIQEETEIFYLDQKYYSNRFGVSLEPINEEELLYV